MTLNVSQKEFDEINNSKTKRKKRTKEKYTATKGEKVDNNISKLIHDKNMTQVGLAHMVGVKREYLNRIIHRKITPTVPLGMRIAKALETPMEKVFIIELIGGD